MYFCTGELKGYTGMFILATFFSPMSKKTTTKKTYILFEVNNAKLQCVSHNTSTNRQKYNFTNCFVHKSSKIISINSISSLKLIWKLNKYTFAQNLLINRLSDGQSFSADADLTWAYLWYSSLPPLCKTSIVRTDGLLLYTPNRDV